MAKIRLQFEMDKQSEMAPTAALIQQKLAQLPEVEKAKATPEEARMGVVEAATIIGGVVILARNTGNLIDEIRKLIPKFKALADDLRSRGVKNVYVEVGTRRVDITELNDADAAKLVE